MAAGPASGGQPRSEAADPKNGTGQAPGGGGRFIRFPADSDGDGATTGAKRGRRIQAGQTTSWPEKIDSGRERKDRRRSRERWVRWA
jgi:hypothetical protein